MNGFEQQMTMHYPLKTLLTITALASLLSTTGCGNFLKPHRINVQQGNVYTIEMVEKLKPGLSKEQVEYIMGTPLIVDTFQPDQWYYHYSLLLGSGETIAQTLYLTFSDGQLIEMVSQPPLDVSGSTESSGDNAVKQILQSESEKLEKSLPDQREDSRAKAGL